MESTYNTPSCITPVARNRRRALSPNTKTPAKRPLCTESPEIITLDLDRSEIEVKMLDQEKEINMLKSALKEQENRLANADDKSILIETSNIFHVKGNIPGTSRDENKPHESYRMELLRRAEDQIKMLSDKNKSDSVLRNNLEKEVAQLNTELTDAQEMMRAAQNGKSHADARIIKLETRIENLTMDVNTKEALLSREKEKFIREKDLLRQKIDQLQQELITAKEQLGNVDKKEIEAIRRSLETRTRNQENEREEHIADGLRQLSSQITTFQGLPPALSKEVGELQQKIGSLQATKVHMEEKLADSNETIEKLRQDLSGAKESLESAQKERTELKEKLNETEKDIDNRNRYLVEENRKVIEQRADIRCELLDLKREYAKLQENQSKIENRISEENCSVVSVSKLEKEVEQLKQANADMQMATDEWKHERAQMCQQTADKSKELQELKTQVTSLKDELEATIRDLEASRALGEKVLKLQERNTNLLGYLKEFEQFTEELEAEKKRHEGTIVSLRVERDELSAKLMSMERSVEGQRSSEATINRLKVDNDRLTLKYKHLQEEHREAIADHSEELLALRRQLNEALEKHAGFHYESDAENKEREDALKREKLSLQSQMKSLRRQMDELKQDNGKIQQQVTDLLAREASLAEENTKLRQGMSDAVEKIRRYKSDYDDLKQMTDMLAEQLHDKEQKMIEHEDTISELQSIVDEKERVQAYLQSQVSAGGKPQKVSRRSTLLRTLSETSLSNTMVERLDNVPVEDLTKEKEELQRLLDERKSALASAKVAPPSVCLPSRQPGPSFKQPSAPPQTPQSKSNVELRMTPIKAMTKAVSVATAAPGRMPGMMRHDIPHKWKELRQFSLMVTVKCGVCFVGIPTFGKARRCQHCSLVVHAHCSPRVVNTCGLPDLCANYYLQETCTEKKGRMNGWVKIYRDDWNRREWKSAWALMDERTLKLYDKENVQSDLSKPFMVMNFDSESFVVRAGNDDPVKTESHSCSIIHCKTQSYSLYLVAPSVPVAKRWAEALQSVQQRRMVSTTRRPSSVSDQTCLLVLNTPNNITIHATHVLDDYLLLGAQEGLFCTSVQSPRLPIRLSGVGPVTAVELIPELNIAVLIVNAHQSLAILPLSTLLGAVKTGGTLSPDRMHGYDHLHMIMYHEVDNQKYLIAVDRTRIHILKYHSSKDVFTGYQTIDTSEPPMCLQKAVNGFYYGADSFFFVEMSRGSFSTRCLVESHVADYPMAILPVGEDEVLLAYQNYGIFVNSKGQQTRKNTVEWEQLPMEFAYTTPYLYVVHFDSIEIMQIEENKGYDSGTISEEREVFGCQNAHIVGKKGNGDVLVAITSTDSVELHRFNATGKRQSKRKALSGLSFNDKKGRMAH